jgi:hypothetical protein
MTPEDRAKAITFPSGKRGADFAEHLRVKIANAIRAAVEQECERCATHLEARAEEILAESSTSTAMAIAAIYRDEAKNLRNRLNTD